jgi:hypothetical protein
MSQYLLIESTEPSPAEKPGGFYDLARELAALGHNVTLFLVQNAVLATRRGVRGEPLAAAVAAGVTVRADDFSLRERGIGAAQLTERVEPCAIEAVVDALANGHKTLWH